MLKKKTTEGILEKTNLVFYSVPNFFAQLSTLLHLPRYVIKVYFKLEREIKEVWAFKATFFIDIRPAFLVI